MPYVIDANIKNIAILESIIQKDKCTIDLKNYKIHLNRDTQIEFICHCENKHNKALRYLLKTGAFCNSCTNKNSIKKYKQTNLNKYGVEHPMQNLKIHEQTKQTNLIKYGVKYLSQNAEIKEKIKQVHLVKRGVENPFQSDKIKYLIKQSNLIKYGVEHPMQNSEFSEKHLNNSFKSKNFTLPDGTIIKVQGYESIAIQILLDKGHAQNDIITSRTNIPEIWYSDLDNKVHRYYCDIYIPSENKIIEVKSLWTYKNNLHINTLKAETCKAEGYHFEFWIINKDKSYEISIY